MTAIENTAGPQVVRPYRLERRPEAAPADLPDARVLLCLAFRTDTSQEQVDHVLQQLVLFDRNVRWAKALGAFHLVADLQCPRLDAFFECENALKSCVPDILTRIEASFICAEVLQERAADLVWYSEHGDTRSICLDEVQKIKAERDYMRFHSGNGKSWLIHATMGSLAGKLSQRGFIQLHRSTLVRATAIVGLEHRASRWIVTLADGTSEAVSKTYLKSVRTYLLVHSAI